VAATMTIRARRRLDLDASRADPRRTMNPLAGPTAAPLPPGVPDAPTEAFAVLRDVLTSAKFDERTVSARLGVPSLYDVKRLADGRTTLASTPEDANGVLVRLFIDSETLPPSLVERLLSARVLGALHALGLVAPAADGDGSLAATAMLYPTPGLWLASDRMPMRVADMHLVPQDYVFSAVNDLTQQYLAVVPDSPGGRVLE